MPSTVSLKGGDANFIKDNWIIIIALFLVLFIIISHIALLFMVGKLYQKVVGSLLKVDMCGIRETEGDTVRYTVMKALQEYNDTLKWVRQMMIASLVFSFAIFILIFFLYFLKEMLENGGKSWAAFFYYVLLFIAIAIIPAIPIIGLVFLDKIPDNIKSVNDNYMNAKDTIVEVIKKITKKYDSFNVEDSDLEYPKDVKRLYKFLLERWSSRNDGTIEDAVHALSVLSKNKEYEEIFTYLKLDSSLEDQELLINICKDYIYKCEGINDVLDTFQIYLPQKAYKNFKIFVENRLIALLIMLFIYLLPFFHGIYHTLGAASIGITTIAIAFFVISFSYMRL